MPVEIGQCENLETAIRRRAKALVLLCCKTVWGLQGHTQPQRHVRGMSEPMTYSAVETRLPTCGSYGILARPRKLMLPVEMVRAASQVEANMWGHILCCVYTWFEETEDANDTPHLFAFDGERVNYAEHADLAETAEAVFDDICAMSTDDTFSEDVRRARSNRRPRHHSVYTTERSPPRPSQ